MSFQVPNYLSNSARAAMRFGGEVWDNLVDGMHVNKWNSAAFRNSGNWMTDILGNTVTSDKWRQQYVWPYTNP